MRTFILKSFALFFFLGILIYSVGFDFGTLFDAKGIFLVLFGTFLLAFATWGKGTTFRQLCTQMAYQATTASYLTTFVFLFSYMMSEKPVHADFLKETALALRPIFYGYILHLILTFLSTQQASKPQTIEVEEDTPQSFKKNLHLLLTSKEVEVDTSHSFNENLHHLLTPRELEIAFLLAKGEPNKVIAHRLYISETTVKKHASHIYTKLEINGKEDLKKLL